MTETFVGSCDRHATLVEAVAAPSENDQKEFFKSVFTTAKTEQDTTRYGKGPLLDAEFMPIMEWMDERLKDINGDLRIDATYSEERRSAATTRLIKKLSVYDAGKVNRIRDDGKKLLQDLATERLLPTLKTQNLPAGVLDEPPYAKLSNHLGCAIACFRMVFGGVAGWVPTELAIKKQLLDVYDHVLTEDSVYARAFQTPECRDMIQKNITTIDIMGTDLNYITTLSSKLKRRPDVQDIYCIADLASLNLDNVITSGLHKVILLEADGENITYHDPKPRHGARTHASYEEFTKRWALAYNRVQLAVVQQTSLEG